MRLLYTSGSGEALVIKQFLPHCSLPCIHIRKNDMDYAQKLDRMDKHLEEHPHDYQTVIARLKTQSDMIDHEMRKSRCKRLKRLAEIRRKRKEHSNGEEFIE